MYKVILVDDEPLIREGMKQVVDWADFDFTICGDAESAKEGLELIELENPDLIFADIRMPGMSGIEFVKEAKRRGFTGEFVILSGYSNFDYARESIKLGVHSYLLKPIDEEELEDVLNDLKTLMDHHEQVSKKLMAYRNLDEEDSWRAVIEGRLHDWKRSNHIDDRPANYHLVGIQTTGNINDPQIKSHIINELSLNKPIIIKDNWIYLIYIDQFKDTITYETTQLLNYVQVHIDPCAYALVSNSFQSLEDASTAVEEIDIAFERAYNFDHHQPFYFDAFNAKAFDPLDVNHKAAKIVQTLEFKDKDTLDEQLKDIKRHFQIYQLEKTKVQAELLDLALSITGLMTQQHPAIKKIHKYEWLDIIHKERTLDDALMSLRHTLWLYTKDISGFVVNSENNMEKIIAYVNQYYDQELNLKILADLFNYNASYLGKKFKKHTGDYFHTYLEKVRIEQAKLILETENLKIYRVSELVGYVNMDYFYKKFKKHVGMSPKEYQKKAKNKH